MLGISKGSRVAVTGATGFIGRYVSEALALAGYRPVTLARSPDVAARILPSGTEVRYADILDPCSLANSLSDVAAAVHVAGVVSVQAADKVALKQVNVEGMRNMLAASRRVGLARLLVMSSTSAVGALPAHRPADALDEDAPFNLAKAGIPYVTTKRAGHEMAIGARRDGDPVITLSPTFVLGPGDGLRNGTALVDLVSRNRLPVWPGGGVNPIDVRDVAAATVAALTCVSPEDHYILAGRDNITLAALVGRIARLSGARLPWLKMPYQLALAAAALAETIAPHSTLTTAGVRLSRYYWYFKADSARRDLGLDTRPLDMTLKDTLAGVRAQHLSAPFPRQELS
ncbi:NAD-dependent epimerase/dehydratase family protein [Kordiimonas lipolytica]|uniref:NAD-dependent epimerase/dehydratase family protein n=1 Tax=Kordiimonas lipolytica TaxID=1662421 RepID=A0ABV8U7E9_9PROT|nr:NAD-dependent epimerase/dehydratase family protein [Kordiimonas lipolytica]